MTTIKRNTKLCTAEAMVGDRSDEDGHWIVLITMP